MGISTDRKFRAHFGVSPLVCYLVWMLLANAKRLPTGAKPIHLLPALLFMKVYSSEAVLSPKVGMDEKTYREWNWQMIESIASLAPHVVRTTDYSSNRPLVPLCDIERSDC